MLRPTRLLGLCLGLTLVLPSCGGDGPKTSEAAVPPAKTDGPTKTDPPVETGSKTDGPKPDGPQVMGIMVSQGDLALERLREHVEAGAVTPKTLARVEKDRGRAGMGHFAVVLDDASSIIESGRVAPGTTVEIHIHAGLGGEEPPLPPADEIAADVIFEDAKTKRRVARVSPLPGFALAIEPFSSRVRNLLRWWAQDPEGQDVEIAINPDSENPMLPVPADLPYALLEPGGVVDRPLLLFPDGSSKSTKEWLGR